MEQNTALLTEWQSKLEQARQQVMNFVVTDTTAGDATEFQKQLKSFQREVETIRKGIETPLKQQLAAAVNPWKELETACKACWEDIRKKLTTYQIDLEKKRRAEQERIQRENAERIRKEAEALAEAAAQTDSETLMDQAVQAEQYAEQVQHIPVAAKGTVTTEWGTKSNLVITWDYEITNEDEVPRQLCSSDRGKIRAMVNDLKKAKVKIDEVDIPGVRVFEKQGLQTR